MAATPHRFRAQRLPAPQGPTLRSVLAREHARQPFTPADVRDAARRVAELAAAQGLEAVVVRGGLDLGGAELDHVWVAVEERVVDVALPVRSEAFRRLLRAFVWGEVAAEELDHVAHGYRFDWRVVGEFPELVDYVGRPVWGSDPAAA